MFTAAPSHDVTLRVRDEHGQPAVALVPRRGHARTRLSGAQQAARAGLLLSAAGLSRRWRDAAAAGGRLHVHGRPRSGVRRRDGATVTVPENGLATPLDFRLTRWMDAGVARLVFGRSPRARRGLQPLREPDRRRQARGHDAARPRRGAQHRRRAELGPELLPPAAVLRGARQPAVHRRRRCCATTSRSPGSRRATAATSCLLRLQDQDYPDTRQIEDWPSWDLPILKWAQGAGRGRRLRALRLGPAGQEPRAAELRDSAVRRHRRQRVHRRRHARRRRLHLGGRHAVRARAEHLVSHAELRLPDPHQRRDRLSLHHATSGSEPGGRTCSSTGR